MMDTGFAFNYTMSELKSSVDTTNTIYDYLSKVIFALWVAALIAIGFYLWFGYLNGMKMRIWRTQGMLSMIPFEIISSNPKMREVF